MTAPSYTGQYGLVLLPDISVARQVAKLAESKKGNLIRIGEEHRAHLTLFHTQLRELPEEAMKRLLLAVSAGLPVSGSLCRKSSFGGKFWFWDVAMSEALMSLHTQALSLAQYFHAEGTQQAEKEELHLSASEVANMQAYGHPLVRDLWRPHITLGYFPDGIHEEGPEENVPVTFDRVAFAKIGEWGTVGQKAVIGIIDSVYEAQRPAFRNYYLGRKIGRRKIVEVGDHIDTRWNCPTLIPVQFSDGSYGVFWGKSFNLIESGSEIAQAIRRSTKMPVVDTGIGSGRVYIWTFPPGEKVSIKIGYNDRAGDDSITRTPVEESATS